MTIFADGLMARRDTHEEILKLNSTYARLFNIQAKEYK